MNMIPCDATRFSTLGLLPSKAFSILILIALPYLRFLILATLTHRDNFRRFEGVNLYSGWLVLYTHLSARTHALTKQLSCLGLFGVETCE